MSHDRIVGKWENEEFTILDSAVVPIYLAKTGNVNRWLVTRAIDYHRPNSRLLKRALRLTEKDDLSIVISVNAATITDNYWIKPFESNLTYNDIRFNNDYFAKLALIGDYDSYNDVAFNQVSHTPELTNIGSFEKCWRLIGGEWWMVKSANRLQQFSELFIFEFGRYLGFNMAEYIGSTKSVMTRDFTDGARYNYEPAYSFMGDNEDYIAVVKELKRIAPNTVPDYFRMIFLDTIVANPDRHTFNFGLLRDAETGDIISLAPNYDNNMALVARGYPKNIKREKDILVKYLNELLQFDTSLKQYIPHISKNDIQTVLTKLNMKVRTDTVISFIMNGYMQIDGVEKNI